MSWMPMGLRWPMIAAQVVLAAVVCAGAATGAERSITLYLYSEYIDPAILERFQQKTRIHVAIDVYEAQEEMLAKMRAGGSSQYDVVVASDVIVPSLIALKLVRPLDQAHIPNHVNVEPRFANPVYDPLNRYSWPYQWGTVGIMYRPDRVHPPISWAMVFDPARQPGPVVLMDEMRSQMAVALKYLGKSINSRDPADVAAAGQLLLAAKGSRNCLGFDGGVGGKNKVMAGDAVLAVVYNGDAVKAMAEDTHVAFAIPQEGSLVAMDNLLVGASSHDAAAAESLINYLLDPTVGAQLSNFTRYATPNHAALGGILKADLANAAIYPPPAVVAMLESLCDLGASSRLYDQVWTSVKSR